MHRSHRAALLLALALLTASCGGDGADDAATTSTTAGGGKAPDTATGVSTPEYLAFRSQPTACGAEAPPPATAMRFDAPDDLGLDGTVEAVLHTSCGEIRLALDAAAAPATVNSFVFLAEQGYFDGTAVHRVAPGFVIQAGDPTGSGRGGPGYTLPDELPASSAAYTAGTVAMANAGPDTGGSQFFLMLEDRPLPPAYSVFGEVTAGEEVMERIASVPLGVNPGSLEESLPLESVYLERVEILR